MEMTALLNKKTVRKNKGMKKAQRAAKKRYGRVRMEAPKMKLNKVVQLESAAPVSFCNGSNDNNRLKPAAIAAITEETLLSGIREAGLQGMSGGGFPIADKLQTFIESNHSDRVLIVNAVECEPSLLHDEWILSHKLEEVRDGIRLITSALSINQTYLAGKIDDVASDSTYTYVKVPNRYPMGQEMVLIKAVLGKALSSNEIPAQKGILVMNVQSLLQISMLFGTPAQQRSRYLTASNLTNGTARIVEAPMGMKVSELAKELFPGKTDLYTGGGALLAHKLEEDEVVDATTGFIGCGVGFQYESNSKCKGCGGCSKNCPMGVDVRGIIRAKEKGQKEGFDAFHPERCIGCGTCSYICMAGKNSMEIIAGINGK